MISWIDGQREILGLAQLALEQAWTDVLGIAPTPEQLRWEGVEEPALPAGGYYARTSIQTVIQDRASIGTIEDATAIRYRNEGLLFIQVFAAKNQAGGYFNAKRLASALRSAFTDKSTATGIYFRNVRAKDNLPKEKQWLQAQMVAEWQFDELRTRVAG
jgi:hypothetical protein